jgi:ferredoxin
MVLFPVYAFDAPEPIYQWIKKLPKGNNRKVAIISVSGGGDIWPNSACSLGVIKRFKRKDYKIVYDTMMVMPSNIMVAIDQHLAIRLLKILPIKAEKIIDELLDGIEQRLKPKISGRILAIMCKLEKPSAKLLAKTFKIREKCNACGWCVKKCPKSNIDIQNNKPIFKWKCVACLRCIYGCPQNAIYTKLFSFLIIKEGYSLECLKYKANDYKLEPLDDLKFGVFFKGVKKYLMK